jgi:hypothetical protein
MSDPQCEILPDEVIGGYDGRALRHFGCEPRHSEPGMWLHLQQGRAYREHTVQAGIRALADYAGLSFTEMVRRHTIAPALCVFSDSSKPDWFDESPKLFNRYAASQPNGAPQACMECVREDLAWRSFSYWRRMHQMPGISICPKHGIRLERASAKNDIQRQPHVVFRSASPTKHHPSTLEQRIAALWSGLLEFTAPVPRSRAVSLICGQLRARKVCTHTEVGRQTLAGLLASQADPAWLAAYFGAPSGITNTGRWGTDRTGAKWYCLALALLFDSPDEVLNSLRAQPAQRELKRAELNNDPAVRQALQAFVAGASWDEETALACDSPPRFAAALRHLAAIY